MQKIAVIIVAHGEAETAGFIDNFSMIRHTLAHASEFIPIPKPLQVFVSLAGGLKNSIRFRKLGYASPQNAHTRKQAEALGRELMRRPSSADIVYEVFPAHTVTPPFFGEVIDRTGGYDARIMLYMAPVENGPNHGSLCSWIQQNLSVREQASVKVVSRFWRDRQLVELYLDHVFHHAGELFQKAPSPVLILAFHGSIVADSEGRPPSFQTGVCEMIEFGEELKKAFLHDTRNSFSRIIVSFLNHDLGGTWTEPSLEETLAGLGRDAAESVALFPAGYFSDGTETCLNAREALLAAGIRSVAYIPCVNDSDMFAGYLSQRVAAAAEEVLAINGGRQKDQPTDR